MKPIHLCAIVTVFAVATVHAGPPQSTHVEHLRVAEAYGRQPLGFEVNRGQAGGDVRSVRLQPDRDAVQDVQFVARGAGYTLFLTSTEAVLRLRTAPHDLRMKLVDSNAIPQVSHDDELPGKSNYVIGSDRRNWHTQVPRYGKVTYRDVYPGVDLVYYGNQQQLEYDFVVAPGADPDAIELAFDGADYVWIDNHGDLLLKTGDREVRLKTPVIYQQTDGQRVEIPGGYKKTGRDRVAFHFGAYDSTRPLVIDPVLIYSTYLGGSNQDFALGIATDQEGSAYVTGFATSIDFPTSGGLQPACAGAVDGQCEDAFITKIRGGTVQYSTYLGGTGRDMATGIAVRPETGEAYIAGWTQSPDFPTVNAIDGVFGEHIERAFAAKLSSDGSGLVYSTYVGGDEPSVRSNGIAVDSDGAAYVTGSTSVSYGGPDVFVTKLTPDGSAVRYSNRFGGSGNDIGLGIAVDAQGYASVTGTTDSPDFPRFGPTQPAGGGFAAKLAPDGSAFVYSTYLFGLGTGVAIAGPNTYITGVTQFGGPTDAFVEVLNFGGQVINFVPLGGTGEDRGSAIGIDYAGNIWVTGVTSSPDFPLINPLQGQVHDLDAFVVKFNSNLVPLFSTYLGGGGREQPVTGIGNGNQPWPVGPALAVDRFGLAQQLGAHGSPGNAPGLAYVAGFTDSTDFPTVGLFPGPQPATHGPINSYVAWIFDDGIPTKPDLAVTELGRALGGVPAEAQLGTTLYYMFQVTNKSPARTRDVVFFDKLPPGVVVERVLWQPSYLYPRNCVHDVSWVFCDLGPLSQGESAIVNIDVTPTTVGAQIDTAAVADASGWACPTCLSTPFLNWFYGFTQDLIWGADANTDADIHDNTATTTTVMTPGSADLSVTGSPSSDYVMLDGILTYTLDVENHSASTTAATLVDTLPAGVTLISATQTGGFGSCAGTSVITCQWPSLSGLAQVTIVVRASAAGTLTNTAVVSGTASDPDSANNAVTFVTRVNRPPTANAGPDQIVSAGASCQAVVTLSGMASTDLDGDTLTYTWTADNLLPPPILLSGSSSGTVTGPTPTAPLPLGTHTITLTVNDGHGGTASDTVVITVRDVTAPTFSGVPAPITVEQANQSGTTVTVGMPTAADNCSGSVAVSSNAPATFPPGPTIVTFTARDAAGNSATAATIVTVVDATPPTVAIVSPQARAYLHSDALTMSFSATDAGSGLRAGMPTAALDGAAVGNGQSLSLLTLGLGTHSFVASATDVAGNTRSQTVAFTVTATIESLIASVNVFAGQGKIDDSNTVKSLLAKLNDAQQAAQRGSKTVAINKLQEFIDLVRAQSGRHITPDAAQILIADAQYVIGTLR